MYRLFVLFTLLAVLATSVSADGTRGLQRQSVDKRFALVIGNNDYSNVVRLEKAANDANAISKALEKVGYQTTLLVNVNRRQMNISINRFVEDIGSGGEGVLYFAGHGVQINNENYLLPVDIDNPRSEIDVADQAVNLQRLQDKIAQARPQFTLLVIDACRDNPLPRRAGRSLGALRGMAQASSAEGQMVIFSAGANQQALDKLSPDDRDPNGVFTRELLPWLSKPGISVRQTVQEVRRAVYAKAKSVNHEQFPAVYDQVLGDFYFVPVQTSSAPAPAPVLSPQASAAIPVVIDGTRPRLLVAALGLPSSRRFWSHETETSYTKQLQAALQRAGKDVLGIQVSELDLGKTEFDTLWKESNQTPQSRALCATSPAPQAVLAVRVETPTSVISPVDSAYWPELQMRLFVCADQRIYRQQKILVPQNTDAWPFSIELESEVDHFLRENRARLVN